MNWEAFLTKPEVVIPVLGIVCGGVIALYSMYCKHQERIAMIENGIDPDKRD
ncbi:MAG: hypothetical protein AAGD07_15530 [Planctomycetota bacterium]